MPPTLRPGWLLYLMPVLLLLFLFGLPIVISLPYSMYLLLFHSNSVLAYWQWLVQLDLDNSALIWSGILVACFTIISVVQIDRQRRKGRRTREARLARGEPPDSIDLTQPMELPAPVTFPTVPMVIAEQRSRKQFLILASCWVWFAALAYLGWAQDLFRWPPNSRLDVCIIGCTVAFAVLACAGTWWGMPSRQIGADEVRLVVRQRGKEQVIFWSDVRQLVLLPVLAANNQRTASEKYFIVTTDTVLDLAVPITPRPGDQRGEMRALIALAMHQTRLPLLAEHAMIPERDALLIAQADPRQQLGKNIARVLAGLGAIVCAVALLLSFHPNAPYHPVTGQLADYTLGKDSATLRLRGNATAYSLTAIGVYPYPPDALPDGAPIMMLVHGTDIGQLDVQTPDADWHIVTQEYAEPWYAWLEAGVIATTFLALIGIPFSMAGSFFIKVRKGRMGLFMLDPFPAITAPQIPNHKATRTPGELRRYARQQGRWWGVDPKELREAAFCLIGGGGLLLAVTLALLLHPAGRCVGECGVR
jgi:hypothetical protein